MAKGLQLNGLEVLGDDAKLVPARPVDLDLAVSLTFAVGSQMSAVALGAAR